MDIKIIVFLVGVISLILTKEQKISEFRQKWIDGIRKDIASLLGKLKIFNDHYKMVSESLHKYDEVVKDNPHLVNDNFNNEAEQAKITEEQAQEFKNDNALEDYREKIEKSKNEIKEIIPEILILINKIKLRLNKNDDEDKSLLEDLKNIENYINNTDKIENIINLTKNIEDKSHTLLKKEWERVKKGEPNFFIGVFLFGSLSLIFSFLYDVLLFIILILLIITSIIFYYRYNKIKKDVMELMKKLREKIKDIMK